MKDFSLAEIIAHRNNVFRLGLINSDRELIKLSVELTRKLHSGNISPEEAFNSIPVDMSDDQSLATSLLV